MKAALHVIALDHVQGSHRVSRDCRCGPRPYRDLTAGADPSAPVVWVHQAPPQVRRADEPEEPA